MDYSTIVEVHSTDNEKTANLLLSYGWFLITTSKSTYDYDVAPNDHTVHYILGRPFNVSYSLNQLLEEKSTKNSSFRSFEVPGDQ